MMSFLRRIRSIASLAGGPNVTPQPSSRKLEDVLSGAAIKPRFIPTLLDWFDCMLIYQHSLADFTQYAKSVSSWLVKFTGSQKVHGQERSEENLKFVVWYRVTWFCMLLIFCN
jgi:hypothetical protein